MNTNRHLASKLAFAAFLALGTLAVTSCNKDKNQTGQEVPNGTSQVVVRISGISDGEGINTKGSNSRTSSSNHSIELVQANGVDAIVALDNNLPSSSLSSDSQGSLRAASGTRAATMANNTKYRLFLYKKVGTAYTYVSSHEFQVSQETPISLEQGTYKWVALSYNNTDAVPDRGADDNFELTGNKDALYAASTQDLVVGASQVPINVTFKRLFARVGIEINTKGLFGPISSASSVSVTGHNSQTGTIDLKTGNFVGALTTGTAPTIAYSDFQNVSGTDASQKVAYFYTAGTTAQNINVTINNLQITLDGGATRTFPQLSFTRSLTTEPGKNQRFLVGFAETALTYKGVKWSRSNLYYKAGDPTPYRFKPTNDYNATKDPNSFFSYGGYKPGVLASQANPHDPCALVYPAGLWKTPASADIQDLTSNGLNSVLEALNLNVVGSGTDILVGLMDLLAAPVAGSSVDQRYAEFTAEGTTGQNPAYGNNNSSSNKLHFNFNGFVRDINVIEDLLQLNLGSTQGQYAAFWTNDRALSLPFDILNLGVMHYMGHRTGNGITGFDFKAYKTTNLLSLDLAGLNVLKSSVMNVRCVRDASFAAKSALPTYDPNPVLPN